MHNWCKGNPRQCFSSWRCPKTRETCLRRCWYFYRGDVQVADYVVIGANSVLTKDVLEPGVIVAGVPAKVIRKLTEEEKKMLEW